MKLPAAERKGAKKWNVLSNGIFEVFGGTPINKVVRRGNESPPLQNGGLSNLDLYPLEEFLPVSLLATVHVILDGRLFTNIALENKRVTDNGLRKFKRLTDESDASTNIPFRNQLPRPSSTTTLNLDRFNIPYTEDFSGIKSNLRHNTDYEVSLIISLQWLCGHVFHPCLVISVQRFLKLKEALELLNSLDSDESDIEISVISAIIAVLPDISELTDKEGDDHEANSTASDKLKQMEAALKDKTHHTELFGQFYSIEVYDPNAKVTMRYAADQTKEHDFSLVYADKPQTLDHLEDNIRRVIADIRPQMLEKVIENWTSRLDYIRASRGSPMPEMIFKM
ncbi:hypothetical protein TNCV_182461 [Trichonephila clavipes]|nr:hypothetical protein TNCV_182461 [Trichonephila clavipes]